MDASPVDPRGSRPGGRSAQVRERVLAAAADELLEHGFERFAVTRVAERAEVHHTTIYRRWPTKSELVFDAVVELADAYAQPVDQGSLRADLRAYFIGVGAAFGDRRTAALIRGLVAIRPDDLVDARRAYWAGRFRITDEIFERAAARGEVVAPADRQRAVELIAGPLWMRGLVTSLPIDEGVVGSFVDDALRAIGHA
ncbi:MAG: TetR/AcrR family transcriptional regulator [Solirubrobacteraceae bacterium]|nr:TetR/AcrR family transcriptional regulator [Patulibacter sp.]